MFHCDVTWLYLLHRYVPVLSAWSLCWEVKSFARYVSKSATLPSPNCPSKSPCVTAAFHESLGTRYSGHLTLHSPVKLILESIYSNSKSSSFCCHGASSHIVEVNGTQASCGGCMVESALLTDCLIRADDTRQRWRVLPLWVAWSHQSLDIIALKATPI